MKKRLPRAQAGRASGRLLRAACALALVAGMAPTPEAMADWSLPDSARDAGDGTGTVAYGVDGPSYETAPPAGSDGTGGEEQPNAYRLIVGLHSGQKPDSGKIVAASGDVYLLSYGNVGEMSRAKEHYDECALYASVDARIAASGGSSAGDANEASSADDARGMTGADNPIVGIAETAAAARAAGATVAVIDTGASAGSGACGRVSVLGDAGDDGDGHGTSMVETVLSEDPSAKVLSIKALGDGGEGNVSSVWAAIEVARQSGAKYINLSFSTRAHTGCAAIDAAVADAVASGCTVVAAAGNDGSEAALFSPANAPGAYTVGARDAQGRARPTSNWGPAVDSWVEAATTSYAAARVTGRFSAVGADDIGLAQVEGADGSRAVALSDIGDAIQGMLYRPAASHAYIDIACHIYGTGNNVGARAWGGGSWVSANSNVWSGGALVPFDDFRAGVNGNGLSGVVNYVRGLTSGGYSGGYFNYIAMSITGQLAAAYRLEYNMHGNTWSDTAPRQTGGAWSTHHNAACDGVGLQLILNYYGNYVQARFQQADGSWSGYSQQWANNYGYLQGVPAWSRAADATYLAASTGGYTAMFYSQTRYVDVYRQSYTATFDPQGGSAAAPITRLCGAALGELPATERYGYRFLGWFTDPVGGTQVTPENVMPTSNVTYYAHWQQLTVLRYHLDDPTTTWKEVVVDALEEPFSVPAEVSDEARNPLCHHLDGTQGLDAWYTDAAYAGKFAPQTLPAGTFDLYARNWASVRYASGPASREGVVYTGEDGTVGSAMVASGFPEAFERPYRQLVALSEPASERITYAGGGRFPSTLRQSPGWHFEADCSDAGFSSYTCEGDAVVYKKWDASMTDGVTTIGG